MKVDKTTYICTFSQSSQPLILSAEMTTVAKEPMLLLADFSSCELMLALKECRVLKHLGVCPISCHK